VRPPVIILEFIAAACISLGVEIASAVAVVALVIVLAALADLLDWPRPR
jgi:hypothetical protein